jgi:2-phosphoglycerate kinase
MNPENNALARTYFIGGSPRIGKSILAYALAEKLHGHVVSTDAIRNAAKKACVDKESDLFAVNKSEHVSEEEWLKNHLETPEVVIDYQNRESKAVWPSIVSFCNSFCEDAAVHIVEGVALLPSLVAEMKHKPEHIIYVGNTSDLHAEAMADHAKKFPEQDWMTAMGYGNGKIAGMANFVREMSLYFKKEAEKHGFPYYEISDTDFDDSIASIIEEVTARGASLR